MTFTMPELISAKREGKALTQEQLSWIVDSYTQDAVPDYQMAPFLMAVLFQGMDEAELGCWTDAMLSSGEVLDLSSSPQPKVDKHSTGGVGDKTSLPLAPLVAACGVAVPMMSGHGLGHTGGTLDKLESIPGFRTEVGIEEFAEQLEAIGIVLAGQSERLVPADRRIYALRDATGTVPSIPLIASSIMSKKLVAKEDLDGLVLDVKVGSGAFMKEIDKARELAATMVAIGRSYDVPVVAVLTAMDQPLGAEVGNANEVEESIAVLRGEGPADVVELTMALGVEMLLAAGAGDRKDAASRLTKAIASGAALEKFAEVIAAQGGDPRVIEDESLLPSAADTTVVTSQVAGTIARCDALTVGRAAVRLGAGRTEKGEEIDHGVGITLHAKVGDEVSAGAPLATVRYRSRGRLEACLAVLGEAWEFAADPQEPGALILEEVR
jgi:pyrimidine-nucleoside phosphorylase